MRISVVSVWALGASSERELPPLRDGRWPARGPRWSNKTRGSAAMGYSEGKHLMDGMSGCW